MKIKIFVDLGIYFSDIEKQFTKSILQYNNIVLNRIE